MFRPKSLYFRSFYRPVRELSVYLRGFCEEVLAVKERQRPIYSFPQAFAREKTSLDFESDEPVTYQRLSQDITQNQRSFLSRVARLCPVCVGG